ncbi:MAG TPA: M23 family metallopeptidase, partial [Nocardioidaceae bacterium]|nr:M23 family metallopeptidase [Nocardioidaceae bacterium]
DSMTRTRAFSLLIVAVAATVVAAGAVANPSTGADSTRRAAAAQPSLDESFGALVATVQKPPRPVLGTDKRRHLVYEIGLVNTAPLTQVIDSVEVIDPAREKVLVAFDDPAEITGIMTTSTTSGAGVDELGPNEAGMLFINVELPARARVPDRLVHQIDSSLPDVGVDLSLNGAATNVAHRGPIVISPPLAGRGYINENGCCGRSDHTRAVLTVDGQSWLAQRFAIDWVRADSEGRIYVGDWQVNDNWIIFGDPVLSATGGTVIETLNTMPENTPPTPAPNLTPYTALGNHVIIATGNGAYALYAHMQPGSVTVEVGDHVGVGEQLGKVGNTGSSVAPHLHFHITDGPSAVGANGIPFVFDTFRLDNLVLNADELNADTPAQTAELGPAPAPGWRHRQLPLGGVLVTLPAG